MLPRKHRLTHKEIAHLKKGAKRVASEHLLLTYKEKKDTSISKVSCSVSKKVEKKAVRRNRLKRQCREATKEHLHLIKRPIVGLVSVKKIGNESFFSVLTKETEELFLKVE